MANATLYLFNKIREESPRLSLKEAQLKAVAQWQSMSELERKEVDDLALRKASISNEKPSTDEAKIPHFPPEFDAKAFNSRPTILRSKYKKGLNIQKRRIAENKTRGKVLRNVASLYGEISEEERKNMKIPRAMAEAVNERNRSRRREILERCPPVTA